jgi:radical SAM protein with 4Fe4S-binding SPASM domain
MYSWTNRYKTQSRVSLAKAIPLPGPLSLAIEISGLCNFRCKFCLRDTINSSLKKCNMSMLTFDAIIHSLKEYPTGGGIKLLVLNGTGESLVNPLFPEMIKKYRFKDFAEQIHLITNASLLTKKTIKAIINSDIDYVKFSIYSVIQDRHEKITGNDINIDSIYENIALFRNLRDDQGKERPFIYIKMIDAFSSENDAFLKKYGKLGDEVKIEPVLDWTDGYNHIKNAYNIDGDDKASPVIEKFVRSLPTNKQVCPLPFYRTMIRDNGDVSLCSADFSSSIIMGNINKETLYNIWNSDFFHKLRIDFLNRKMKDYQPCRHCQFYKTNSANIDAVSVDEYIQRIEASKK